jgi:phosphoribosyl 1,2-cyclic phosphodiesterase
LPQQPGGSCKEILAGQMTETYFPVTPEMLNADIRYITQPPEQLEYDDFKIEFMLANHHTNTAIYKLHFQDTVIVFAPDNEIIASHDDSKHSVNQSLIDFVQGADLVIHDGQYSREAYRDKKSWGHSARQNTIELMRKAEVPKLVITHHDPDSDDHYLQQEQNRIEDRYGGDFDYLQLAYEQLNINI